MQKKLLLLLLTGAMLLTSACTENSVPTDTDQTNKNVSAVTTDRITDVKTDTASETNITSDTDTVGVSTPGGMTNSAKPTDTTTNKTSSTQSASTENTPSTNSNQPTVKKDPLETLAAGSAQTAKLTGTLTATSVCTLKNLPITTAVQQFAFLETNGTVYIFATQRTGDTTYLSRCKYNPDTKTAARMDYAKLDGFGHGESLEVRLRNGKIYVYLTSDGNTAVEKYYWGTTITRFCYTSGFVSEKKTLTDLNCATATGATLHENATSYRHNFAIDEAADAMAMYLKCKIDEKSYKHYIVVYRLSAIDALLDAAESEVSMKNCTSAILSESGSMELADICPNKSFQGIELGPENKIYVSGGGAGETSGVMRLSWSQNGCTKEENCTISAILCAREKMTDIIKTSGYPEIESIRYFNGRYYTSFNPGSGLKQDNTEIFLLTVN